MQNMVTPAKAASAEGGNTAIRMLSEYRTCTEGGGKVSMSCESLGEGGGGDDGETYSFTQRSTTLGDMHKMTRASLDNVMDAHGWHIKQLIGNYKSGIELDRYLLRHACFMTR